MTGREVERSTKSLMTARAEIYRYGLPSASGGSSQPRYVLVGEMGGVREYTEEFAVELRRDTRTGRLVVFAYNEGRCNAVAIDFWDLDDWMKRGAIK